MPPIVTPKSEDSSRALLNTSRTTHTFWIFHRQTFIGEVHDIDSLMADGGADIARDTLMLVGKDPVTREPGIDVHQGCEGAGKATPDAPAKPEV